MAITLQLATALQKTTPPSTAAAAPVTAATGTAANTAGDDAPPVVPFATLIDDLLKPLDAAQTAVVADTAPAVDLPSDAAPAGNAAADAATQALLASLLVPAPPLNPSATAATAVDTTEAEEGVAALPLALSQMADGDELASGDALLLAQGRGAAPQSNVLDQASAPTMTPAPGDRSLPEVAANLAAPGFESRLRALMPERALREDVHLDSLPLTDGSHARTAAPATALAASGPSAGAAPLAQYSIPEPVAGSRWADALGQRAMFMVDQQIKSAELHLNPPNLGPLEVKLALDGDKATLSFSTNQAAVREAVQQSLPRLHQVFADNGMAELNVQVHLGQQQQPQQQERQAGQSGQGAAPSGSMPVSDIQIQAQASRWHSQSYAAARGGVDIFA